MNVTFVGVDPGYGGAVAMLRYSKIDGCWCRDAAFVEDLPVHSAHADYFEEIRSMRIRLLKALDCGEDYAASFPTVTMIEKPFALPLARVKGSILIEQGFVYGVCVTVFGWLMDSAEIVDVKPNVWKAAIGVSRTGKEGSLALARELFPWLGERLKLKKHHNRAEALLIAYYCAITSGLLKDG